MYRYFVLMMSEIDVKVVGSVDRFLIPVDLLLKIKSVFVLSFSMFLFIIILFLSIESQKTVKFY